MNAGPYDIRHSTGTICTTRHSFSIATLLVLQRRVNRLYVYMYMFLMKSYTIQLPCIELLAPDEIFHNRDTLKEYSLSHWKDEILRRLIVECPTVNATSNTSKRSTHPSSSYRYTPPPNHDEIKIDATPTNHTT